MEKNTKIIERLSYFLDNQGISFNQLAINLGLSNSYFSKMAKNCGSLGENIIRKILLYYGDISPEWLLLGRGEMFRGSECGVEGVNIVRTMASGGEVEDAQDLRSENVCLRRQLEAKEQIILSQKQLLDAKNKIISLLEGTGIGDKIRCRGVA